MTHARPKVGLVLGAGGVLGAAWLIGALKALSEVSGWDPTEARHVVGTSAGSVVGSLVAAGLPPWFLYHHQEGGEVDGMTDASGDALPDADRQIAGIFRPAQLLPRPFLGSPSLALRTSLQPWRYPPAAAAVGWMWRGFLSTDAIGAVVRTAVPSGWGPHPNLWIVAVDYSTGRRTVFGRDGAPRPHLFDAVEASCAIPGFYRPKRIDGRLYVDGGAWSPSNLDLLARSGVDVVIALNPMSSLHPGPPTTLLELFERRVRSLSGRRLGRETKRVRETGKAVLLIQPDEEDLAAMGVNLMNASRRRLVLETAANTTKRRLEQPDAREVLARL